jgi:murein DD-endopeptidase MepM/ murein hydrolase activator NlpD
MICGLCMFASPFISYKLAQGGVFEGVAGTVAGWMGAIVGVGASVWSSATGAAINRQADQMSANAQQKADGVSAQGSHRAELLSANAKHSADETRSRTEAASAVSSARLEGWATGERADIGASEKIAGEQSRLGETLINNEAKRRAEAFGAEVGLDKANYEALGVVGSVGQEVGDAWTHTVGSGLPANYSDYINGADGNSAGFGQPAAAPFQPRILSPGEEAPGWAAPVPRGGQFSSPRDGGERMHRSTDQSAPAGTPIGVAASGTVSKNYWDDTSGWCLEVDHGGGWKTSYAHMQQQSSMTQGAHVNRGEMIGKVGDTGSGSHGDHLHFVTKLNDQRVDANRTNLRPFLGSSAGNPDGMNVTIPQGNHSIRNAPFGVQEKIVPFEKTRIETGASDAAARAGAGVRIGAAQREAAGLRYVAGVETGEKTRIAYAAHGGRMQAAGIEHRGSVQSAGIRLDSTTAAIGIRHEAAMKQANLRALSTLVTSVGSTVANQMQGAMQQYNRF